MSAALSSISQAREIIRPEITAMSSYFVADAKGYLKMDTMELPWQLPAPLQARVAAALAAVPLNYYPVPKPADLVEHVRVAGGVPEGYDIVLGNGSDELIHLVCQACARPNSCMVAPVPAFVFYQLSAMLDQVRFVGVPLHADFTLDLPALLNAIENEQPAIVFLAYPNNPTGTLYSEADIKAVLRAAPGLVVVDEAYEHFAEKSFMRELPNYPNLVVMRTFSKLGLAGLRLGYMAGHADWMNEFEKVRPPFNINVLSQTAARVVLAEIESLREQTAQIRAERTRVMPLLAAIPNVQIFPSSANFVLMRVRDAKHTYEQLKTHKILVKNVSGMHPMLNNCLRVNISRPEENNTFLNALPSCL